MNTYKYFHYYPLNRWYRHVSPLHSSLLNFMSTVLIKNHVRTNSIHHVENRYQHVYVQGNM